MQRNHLSLRLFAWVAMLALAGLACSTLTTRPASKPLGMFTENLERTNAPIILDTPLARLALTHSPQPTHTPTPTVTPLIPLYLEFIEIPAPSLQGNLLGDPTDQAVSVLLPPSYNSSDRRYPVVYFLPGFGGDGSAPNYFDPYETARLMRSGQIEEMILVTPNGANLVGGSFYVNSSVSGNWEDFILQDLVGYIDDNYRTLPEAGSRAIAGHSMGGTGAFHLSMAHPEVFGACYILSGGLLGPKGLADFHVLNPQKRVENFLAIVESIRSQPEAEALKAMAQNDGPNAIAMAYGMAYAPNPQAGPPFFDYPYKLEDGVLVVDQDAWARWEAGMGNLDDKVTANKRNLRKLHGILIDYARQDNLEWIPRGSEYLARLLDEADIAHELLSFDGGHADHIEERILTVMLPFFDEVFKEAGGE